MQLKRLQIENFCSHGKSDICFDDFQSAIIIGRAINNSKVSNGIGKSTIFDAIVYVLYNEIRFSTLDKIIRHNTEYCKVSLDFVSVIDNSAYRIVRSRSRKSSTSDVRLYKLTDEKFEDITQRRNADTETDIAKLIKINFKTFYNSVLFAQADLSGLAASLPSNRKKILKDALGLSIYSKYEKFGKEKSNSIFKEIEKIKTIISTLGEPEIDIKKYDTELKNIDISIKEQNSIFSSLKIDFENENNKYSSIIKNIDQFSEITSKQLYIKSEIEKLKSEISNYENKISSIKSIGKSLSQETKTLSENIKELSSIKLRSKDEIKLDYDKIEKQLIENKTKLNSLNIYLKELNIPIPTEDICKYCRQKITNDIVACKKHIELEINNTNNIIISIKKDIITLENKKEILSFEQKNIDKTEREISNKQQSLELKSKELETKKSLYSEFVDIINKSKLKLEEKNIELNSIQSPNIDITKLKSEVSTIRTNISKLNSNIENIVNEINKLSNNKAIILHKIETKILDLEKLNSNKLTLSDFEYKYIVHQKVVSAFGATGIPTLIAHTILDDFQIEANSYLFRFRPGLQLKFSIIKDRSDGEEEDTLDINYIIDGFEVEYKQLSGAQKVIVSLALKLGLSAIIKKRLNIEANILLIDEVDQSIDEEGLEIFEATIKELQKDFKILIITHNKDLKEKFKSIIVVERDENSISNARLL